MEKVIYERYKVLACDIIIQMIDDFLKSETMTDYDLYKDFENCSYFDYLDLDREYLYVKVLELKKKGVRHVKFIHDQGEKEKDI